MSNTTIDVTTEGDVTIGVAYNPVAGSGADTNIGITRTNAAVTVTSSSGSDGTILAADASNAGVFTAANFTKLAAITGTNTGDQSIFKNIAVAGQSTVVADTTNDTLTLVAGTNITLTTDALTDSVTINAAGGGGSGDVVGPASATNGAFALFDTTTGKLLKNGSVPGGAATLNVGTSAGTVAAGDDSRFTNARTPTAHASTHITGGTDAIQSATSTQNGLATATQITKLDGIEAGADVTDATNVAAAGAVMKTLADAKGDLFAATAADTVTRLPIGATNGHVLTVDSAETTGMKWAVPSGGDVVGPASSTDNAFARFDSTTGKLLQNSTATLDDVGLASVDGVQFSATPTSAVGPAKAVWSATDSCLSIGLNASVNALVGTDSHVQVYNESASTMTVMQVVRQSGSSGTRLSVELAMANTDANSATSIGVVAQTIASNAQGFIQTSGLLQGVNTNAFNEGDTLWLSATTAGLIANVKPTAPNHGVRIGYCIKKAGGAGIILIDILNGFELDELHDVKITAPIADNSFLTYDTTTSTWINSTDVPATQLTGTIDTARLPATITGLTSVTSSAFVGPLTGTASGNLVAGGALGTPSSGALTNCTSIPAGQLTGTVATARLGTGTASASTYLRGDATWAAVSGGFDPASPGAIGGTTPATGRFTSLSSDNGDAGSIGYFYGRNNNSGGYTRIKYSAVSGELSFTPEAAGANGSYMATNFKSYGGSMVLGIPVNVSDIYIGAGLYMGLTQPAAIYTPGYAGDIIFNNGKITLVGGNIMQMLQVTSGGTPASNSARIYSKDVSGTAEMFVKDEAGNETQISPHNTAAPEILIDSAFDEIGYTANYYTGIITYTNKQRQIAGRADAQFFETFEEHNLRIGESLEILDWDTVQADHVAKREEERVAWATRKSEWEAKPENEGNPFTDTEPEVLIAKPMPTWLADQLAGKEAFLANRLQFKKSWSFKAEFWAEFTDTEKAAIITSEDIGVKMLDKELTMWSGVIIATDSRVIAGLDKLVELSILTETRKDEITTI